MWEGLRLCADSLPLAACPPYLRDPPATANVLLFVFLIHNALGYIFSIVALGVLHRDEARRYKRDPFHKRQDTPKLPLRLLPDSIFFMLLPVLILTKL